MRGKYLVAFMLFYICGIVCYLLGLPNFIIPVLVIGLVINILQAKTTVSAIVLSLFTVFFAVGYLQISTKDSEYRFFYDTFCGRYVTVFGTVDEFPVEYETAFDEKTSGYVVQLSKIRVADEFYETDKKIIVYSEGKATVEIGDEVMLRGMLEKPEGNMNPGGFNYREYLKTDKTAGIMRMHDGAVVGQTSSIFYDFKKLRQNFIGRITECMPEGKDTLARALVLGDRDDMDVNIEKMFSGSGIAHALALSGMHLSVLISLVMSFISVEKIRIRTRAFICSIAVILYVPVAGFSPSLVRAGIMMLFMLGGTLFKRRYDTATAIVFAAAVILSENPFAINSISFQLSFVSTLGIVYFSIPLYTMLKKRISINQLAGFVLFTVISTLTAVVVTLPIVARSFNSISIYGVLGNLLVVPLIELLFSGGIVMLVLSFIFMPLAKVVGFLLAILTDVIIFMSSIISSLKGAFFIIKSPGIFEYLLYASVILAVICIIKYKKVKKYSLILVLIATSLCLANEAYQRTVFRVEFINVGQGDGILVQIPGGKNILIDCGPKGYGETASYLKSKGIGTLDAVYLSHSDSDHSGGLEEILSSVEVKKVVVSYANVHNNECYELLDMIVQKGVDVEFADDGYKEKIGECEIEAVWAENKLANTENSNSMVLKLCCRGKTFLFTGDIDAAVETEMIEADTDVDADVLKVAHHGSKTSTSDEFIQNVSPEYAVISAGKNNSYGHPDKGVTGRLCDAGCNVFCTSVNGYVHFSIDMFGNFCVKTGS